MHAVAAAAPSQEQQQHTLNAHQLCDMAMALVKALVDRVTKGKPIEVGWADSVQFNCIGPQRLLSAEVRNDAHMAEKCFGSRCLS